MKTATKKSESVSQPEISKVEVLKEVPLEKQIEQTLVKNNVTKRVIAAMEEKYGGGKLVLASPTDTENYIIIKEARKDVRKVGILVESLCKSGREDAIRIQKLWLAKEKEVLGEIAKIQDPLDEQIKIYDDEKKRQEEEESNRKDEQFNVRQTQLIKMGAVPANGCLNLNETSIETSLIREADEDTYIETILPLFQRQYEINNQKKIEEENRQKKEREEFELKQKQLQEQQDKMKKEQEELQQQRQQFEQQQRQLQEQKANNRKLQLEAIGMTFLARFDNYSFEEVKISTEQIKTLDDAAWEILLQNTKPAIEQIKSDIAVKEERKTKRSAQLSALGMIFTGSAYQYSDINIPATDLTGMSDEVWNQLIATTEPIIIERKNAAAKKQQEQWQNAQNELQKQKEQQREEEEAKATDKQKWDGLIIKATAFPIPEFKSSVYKGKVNQLLAKLDEIKAL